MYTFGSSGSFCEGADATAPKPILKMRRLRLSWEGGRSQDLSLGLFSVSGARDCRNGGRRGQPGDTPDYMTRTVGATDRLATGPGTPSPSQATLGGSSSPECRLPLHLRGQGENYATHKKMSGKLKASPSREDPGCPSYTDQGVCTCTRHAGDDVRVSPAQSYQLKEQEGREEGDGWSLGSSSLVGKAARCPGSRREGGMGGARALMRESAVGR